MGPFLASVSKMLVEMVCVITSSSHLTDYLASMLLPGGSGISGYWICKVQMWRFKTIKCSFEAWNMLWSVYLNISHQCLMSTIMILFTGVLLAKIVIPQRFDTRLCLVPHRWLRKESQDFEQHWDHQLDQFWTQKVWASWCSSWVSTTILAKGTKLHHHLSLHCSVRNGSTGH